MFFGEYLFLVMEFIMMGLVAKIHGNCVRNQFFVGILLENQSFKGMQICDSMSKNFVGFEKTAVMASGRKKPCIRPPQQMIRGCRVH
jgi:hypothetical protein